MSTKFVSCLYDGLFGTKFCGRSNRGQVFVHSLRTIANINTPIVCYTSAKELPGLIREFRQKSNIELRVQELDEFDFHHSVNSIKDSNDAYYRKSADWKFRCMEIMWGKFVFLKRIIKETSELKYVFWIDSGLSHAGIFHSRFNPHYRHNVNFIHDVTRETINLSARNDLAFNKDFTENLLKYTGNDKILNIVSSSQQHMIIDKDVPFQGSVIGGLFGGNVDLMEKYCDAMIDLFEYYVEQKQLYKEEQLMTKLMNEGNFPLKRFMFDTWYHGDWDKGYYHTMDSVSFCDFFDEINPRR